jgi:hypothetical protein
MSEWLGAADAQSTVDWRGLITSVPPLPLSWQGATVFSHSFYSPLADAALHNAIALASLYELLSERRAQHGAVVGAREGAVVALRQLARGGYIRGVCSSEDGCLAERVARCLDVISRARLHYEAAGQAHEGSGVAALELQVRSLMALAVGNTSTALELLARATVLETDAADLQIPSSVTLFFAPSSALEGLTNLMLSSSRELEPSARAAHARAGAAAFEQCLAPTMHPRMPLCRLGQARALALAGDAEAATASYKLLLLEGEWDHADGACAAGLEEASSYVLRANATAMGAEMGAEHQTGLDEASSYVLRANATAMGAEMGPKMGAEHQTGLEEASSYVPSKFKPSSRSSRYSRYRCYSRYSPGRSDWGISRARTTLMARSLTGGATAGSRSSWPSSSSTRRRASPPSASP